ncbi:MAG: hypothetical protein AB8B69_10025, partial [Chitinophagales bacterium]
MSKIKNNTPVIIGVGQITEVVPEDLTTASSHADLAAKAAMRALENAKDSSLADEVDVIVGVKTFADSSPAHQAKTGRKNNFPRSIAKRIGANPQMAIYDAVGGDSPQRLVSEFAEKLAAGNCELVLLAGGEAIANAKAAAKQKVRLNWSEHMEGQLEDRGRSGNKIITSEEIKHQVILPMQFYALMENARRAILGQNMDTYAQEMGKNTSELSKVAAKNPYAVDQTEYDAKTLITPSKRNPLILT